MTVASRGQRRLISLRKFRKATVVFAELVGIVLDTKLEFYLGSSVAHLYAHETGTCHASKKMNHIFSGITTLSVQVTFVNMFYASTQKRSLLKKKKKKKKKKSSWELTLSC